MENYCKAQRVRQGASGQETYLTNCCRIMLDEASLWLLDV